MFNVSVIPSIDPFESSSESMISIIPFISSFEINKVNNLSYLTTLFPLIYLSDLFIAFEAKLHTNSGKLSIAKGIAKFVSAFSPELINQEPKNPHGLIILHKCTLLSFISVNLSSAKAFPILIACLVVRNNSCGNCSFSY